jgi:hypothetical protein
MMLAAALLLCTHSLTAQRHGGRPGASPGGKSAPVGTGPEVTEFERELAIQATPEQQTLFGLLSQSIDAASQRMQIFARMAGGAPRPADYDLQLIGLRDLLEKSVDNSEIFLGSFSAQQKSRLKAPSKKLNRASAELSRLIGILEQESAHPALDDEHLTRLGEDLGKALAGVRSEQLHLGKLMGIPTEPA